ncbi:HAD-IIIA family hydrolase, partial [Candidatus Sumerlaeota bacterium]|nr:HAD-IIIA family hydrolase [Candidatus Sumerlaeota bacterium]
MTEKKILKRDELAKIVARLRKRGKKVGLTNGVFDILHAGHVQYLEDAKKHCDVLIVSLNTDRSVKKYKDPGRPLVPQRDRARVVAALTCVDYVTFHGERRMRKTLETLRPDFYIKGGDYKPEQLTSRDVVEQYGGKILLLPLKPGVSTSAIIDKALMAYGMKPESMEAPPPKSAPALFLDRDGVINKDKGYISEPGDFETLPGVIEALRKFHDAGYFLVIVTNQGGINLGYYTRDDFYRVNFQMMKILGSSGVFIDKIYFCPHTIKEKCSCRKPGIGMIRKAQKDLPIIMERSLLVGDKETDIMAGKKAGLKTCLIADKKKPLKVKP